MRLVKEIKIAIKWFYYSQIRQRYISQLPQKLDKDLSIIVREKNLFGDLIALIGSERSLQITKDEFVGRGISHPLYNLMKWYFKSKNAVCLGTGLVIKKMMGKKYALENDHSIAYSILKEAGYSQENRLKYALGQEITNRAVLTMVENRSKEAKKADVYLSGVKTKYPDALKLQCIPDDESLWKLDNYELFLEEKRRKILTKELNAFLEGITETKQDEVKISIEELISAGENALTEFKTTLRWDVKEEKVNKKLEEVILKTIAAFSNADGGTLFFGSMNGKVVGLDSDYSTLKEGDKDKFELHFRNLINEAYGVSYTANNISMNFPEIEGKRSALLKSKGTSPFMPR